MYDDGESDSETAYASPRARVDASDDDRDGNGFDSTIRSSRRMAPEDGARRRGEPPVEVTMTRTREGNASRGMIRPSRAMAIDVATLRHVFERIDTNGDGDIDPNEFLEAWSDDPEIGELLTVGCDIACSTESIDDAEKLRRAQNIFDAIDADRNARVTFREFKKYFELRAKTPVRVENSPTKVKPVVFEEFGKHRPVKMRDDHFERVFRHVREHDAAHRRSGALFWLLAPDGVEDYDGFSVYSPSDSSTLDVIRREVESIESFLTRRERGEADEEEVEDEDEDEDEDDSNIEDEDEEDVVVEFPEDESDVDDDVQTLTSGLVRSYACRMFSSNPRDARATYGDRVGLEFAAESTAPVDVFVAEFAGSARERVAVTSSRAVTFANDPSRAETTTTTHTFERIVGDDGAYVDDGPMTFRIFVARRRDGAPLGAARRRVRLDRRRLDGAGAVPRGRPARPGLDLP